MNQDKEGKNIAVVSYFTIIGAVIALFMNNDKKRICFFIDKSFFQSVRMCIAAKRSRNAWPAPSYHYRGRAVYRDPYGQYTGTSLVTSDYSS